MLSTILLNTVGLSIIILSTVGLSSSRLSTVGLSTSRLSTIILSTVGLSSRMLSTIIRGRLFRSWEGSARTILISFVIGFRLAILGVVGQSRFRFDRLGTFHLGSTRYNSPDGWGLVSSNAFAWRHYQSRGRFVDCRFLRRNRVIPV